MNYIALPLVAGSFVDTAGDVVTAALDVYGKAGDGHFDDCGDRQGGGERKQRRNLHL